MKLQNDKARSESEKIVNQWKSASEALNRVKNQELQNTEYDYETVDAMLDLGLKFSSIRVSSGLVEMQRFFRTWQSEISKGD